MTKYFYYYSSPYSAAYYKLVIDDNTNDIIEGYELGLDSELLKIFPGGLRKFGGHMLNPLKTYYEREEYTEVSERMWNYQMLLNFGFIE